MDGHPSACNSSSAAEKILPNPSSVADEEEVVMYLCINTQMYINIYTYIYMCIYIYLSLSLALPCHHQHTHIHIYILIHRYIKCITAYCLESELELTRPMKKAIKPST